MGIEVKFPFLFLLLIPAAIVVFLFIKKNRKKEAYYIAGIRAVLFTLLIFALTVPQILLPMKGETVIFLVDRSTSMNDTEDAALEWMDRSVEHMGPNDSFAIVSFGQQPNLEQQLKKKGEVIHEFNGEVEGGHTNLEAGLQYAYSLIPNHSGGRIVLLSDGNETIGDSKEAAQLLKNRKIELDYVPLGHQAAEDLSLADMNVPSSLYKGEEAEITITIESNANKAAEVRLSVNDQEVITEKVQVKAGKNVYAFSHKIEETGMVVIKGEVFTENDAFTENNVLHSVSNVKGTPRVLIVQDQETGPLQSILSEAEFAIETMTPEKLPTVLSGYLPYQSIIFNNVPATSISENQMNLIEQAVKEFGTGFLMAGGEDSFGLGGYFKTPIERILPVDMDIKGKQEMPSMGLVIVLDRSGSMAGGKLELAKEAAARSVELMREEDTLGFIAFDNQPWVIVETGPIEDKQQAIDQILSVTPGGGTEIYSSLAMAYDELMDLHLQRKHVILLTDGQSATGGNYDSLIQAGKEKNITLSTVALGQDADRGLLEHLAIQGSGRFYDVTDSSVIPSILSRETVMATRTYIEDNPFYPDIRGGSSWDHLFSEGVPQMNAYIATTPKGRAAVPIMSLKEDPILAQWQYGLGTTIAFTSDFSGKWSGDWARYDKWPLFINQMVTETLPQYESEPFRVSLDQTDGETTIHLEGGNSLPIETAVVSEHGEAVDASAKLIAPGKYDITIPNGSGMYFLHVKQTDQNGGVHTFKTGFTVPYSEEYLLKAPNKELLADLAAITGGQALHEEKDAFRPLANKSYDQQSISEWLLLLSFLLFFLEIAIRRFGVNRVLGLLIKEKLPASIKKSEKNVDNRQKHMKTEVTEKTGSVDKTPEIPTPKKEKRKKRVNKVPQVSPEEREERMKRLLEAKNRKRP